VFPGLATARVLRESGAEAALLLSGRDVEAPMAVGWPGPVLTVHCPSPRWGTPAGALRGAASLTRALAHSFRQLRAFRPDALLAMGSYTSVGPVLAARALGVPVVLHEANVIPGAAVARLAPLARCVAVSFAETKRHLPGRTRVVDTGLPVRTGLAGRPPLPGFAPGQFTVLVTGGSQGSQEVNLLAVEAFRLLARQAGGPPRILHLAGRAGAPQVRAAYAAADLRAETLDFLDDMGGAYAAADLCIGRSGAAACLELCLCGPPALLIPLPGSARDHQRANAEALAAAGAAEVLPQKELSAARLAERIAALRDAPERRASMRSALRSLARPDAARRLADLVLETARTDP